MIRYVLQFKCNIFSLNQKKYVKFIVFYLRIGSLRKERIPRFPAPDRSAGKRGRRPHTYYLIVRNAPKQDAEALFGFESAAYIYKLFNNTLRRRRFREIRENSIFPRGMSDTGFRSGKARPPTSGGGLARTGTGRRKARDRTARSSAREAGREVQAGTRKAPSAPQPPQRQGIRGRPRTGRREVISSGISIKTAPCGKEPSV